MVEQRLHFSKTGAARYISHLDLMRTFQRAFLRAGIQVRHTEGFNPHAFVSIPLPLSVGYSSQCEVLEFGLVGGATKRQVPARMNAALPGGIIIHRCYDGGQPAKELSTVNYIISMEYESGVPVGAESAFGRLLARESLLVQKKSKKAKSGFTEVDIIPLIEKLSLEGRRDTITVDAVLKAQNPGLNPELMVQAFQREFPAFAADCVTYHRKAVFNERGEPWQ